MITYRYIILLALCLLTSCAGHYSPPVLVTPFENTPSPPDYSIEASWASLPCKKDNADKVPASSRLIDMQETAVADVFFIHPTSYLKQTEKSTGWNAEINDDIINQQTDDGSILNQASVFNGSCKIYAPRYRQAFIYSYFTNEKEKSTRAFDTAYSDVKTAFKYYLDHYNKNRPIIIASHSQGTTHAIRLVKEFFDDKSLLSRKFIAAYLVGMDVYDTAFAVLQPCDDPSQVNCYNTWRTYAVGYYPDGYIKPIHPTVCTNPLSWRTDTMYVSRKFNNGGVLKKFDKVIVNICDAQVGDGVLRINEPHFRGRSFYNFKNYHIVDYNLFYFNIRQNASERVKAYVNRFKEE